MDHSPEQLGEAGGVRMRKTLIVVCVLLCIGGIALMAGCTEETTPEVTPTPTGTATPEAAETPGLGTPEGTSPMETTTAEETPTDGGNETAGEADIFRTLNDLPEYSVLRDLLITAGLDQTLANEGPFTLFAPNNEAFAGLTEDQVNTVKGNPELLESVLLYHVVEGEYPAATLQGNSSLTSVEGSILGITLSEGEVMVDDAVVVEPDIMASNGVIHGIDAVLVPSDVTLPTAEPTTEATTEATPGETVNQT
jgi:uncharacterized surface protein with fasciclin (FAS1) repeats